MTTDYRCRASALNLHTHALPWFLGRLLLSALLLPTSIVADNMVSELLNSGTVTCQPALPYFCENIHVGCSGRSKVPASPFKITVNGDLAQITLSDLRRAGNFNGVDDDGAVVFRLHPTQDYIKLLPSGEFNYRHYVKRGALMSYGECTHEQSAN